MLKQIEGSQGIAQAVARCRPEVICAYPITPQTHIVEDLGAMVKGGTLTDCEFINVESEFAALSVAIGSSATGARSYTATASQGLLYMAEAVYNASGLGLPIVMTVGNRAIGAPINIWNDQSDSMSMRDAGWIQLFAETNQEALDLHIQAFRIAETLSMPVMVCVDGFILTHAYERMDIPEQEQVDRFLPPFVPRQVLDPADPISMGAMVGPEAFTEVRYLAHHKQMQALELIPQIAAEFKSIFGRDSGGLISNYRTEDAETIIVTLGSVIGTISEVIDTLRDQGQKIGAISLRCYRPFPKEVLREALQGCQRVVVFEKCLAVGMGGIVASNVRMSTRGLNLPVYTVIGGLGGRPITRKSLAELFAKAVKDELDETTFLDIKCDIVERELAREQAHTRSGSAAENILREVGVVDAAKTA
ncbi:MAG: transketolase C-terminal domain-containing protein [Candidatus Thiodiazotropha sp.]